ncbi:Stp1/IreP family PP2C-type Ser/Thr phosphatase [Eubacterium aggregans]|uniref:Stp1/IreP family PP2C-type Ser/Thr phosphatase n=1 Tax=Eubacterium aggregans TaxID=81409 RepID=UPI003F3E4C3E
MKCAYSSNIGVKRKVNQDAYLAANFEKDGEICYIFVVADGLGGHQSGEVASEMAVDYIKTNIAGIGDYTDYGQVNTFVNGINQQILEAGFRNEELRGMATTLTLCIVDGENLVIAHVGDSRAYRINREGIEQLTKDHSLVQALVDEGRLSSSQAKTHPQKNVITRALGTDEVVRTDLFEYTIVPGDKFLVCSDGLYNLVSETLIRRIVLEEDMEEATKELVNTANRNGGNDNITVIIFDPQEGENAI